MGKGEKKGSNGGGQRGEIDRAGQKEKKKEKGKERERRWQRLKFSENTLSNEKRRETERGAEAQGINS